MFRTKLEQSLHELRFAAGFLWNFEAAQGGKLRINVSNLASALADAIEQLEQFFLIAIALGGQLFE